MEFYSNKLYNVNFIDKLKKRGQKDKWFRNVETNEKYKVKLDDRLIF
jgi:hypothetical protein